MKTRNRYSLLVLFAVVAWHTCVGEAISAEEYNLHKFERQQLSDTYFSEGAGVGDLNRDGKADVVYGPYWFAGPDFSSQHEIYDPVPQNREGYADHFFAWVYDFNNDGWNDVLAAGFPGTPAYVYENPGRNAGHWPKHEVFDWVSNEAPQFIQLVGDERPELICTRDGYFGYVSVNWDEPFGKWTFHRISNQITATRFGHGLGAGDINGDGRLDILFPTAWFEQPAENPSVGLWRRHDVNFSDSYGGAEMYAYDVDGDGDNDVITSLAAHDFGMAWYEQVQAGDRIDFKQHLIMGSEPSENRYGVVFSELHSVALADMDGDGLKDIVTGKTFYSHHRQSPQWDAGAVVYWFRLVRDTEGVDWVPYEMDREAGIGRQIFVADVNADGLPDVTVGGMKGCHVLHHRAMSVDEATWKAAQPQIRPVTASADRESIETAEALRGERVAIDSKSGSARGAIEGESLQVDASSGQARPQTMTPFTADVWSGNSHLFWTGARPGDKLAIGFQADSTAVELQLVLTCARDYGIVQLALDDEPLGEPIDLYNRNVVTTGLLKFPNLNIKPGQHTLTAQVVGASANAVRRYMFGLDYLRLRGADEEFPQATAAAEPPPAAAVLVADEYPYAGLTASEAAGAMKLPPGFQVSVFAAEPDVKQPIAMALDDRGRVWIAEAYEYPQRAEDGAGRDRILVFDDTDGDGRFDDRKIFAEGLNLVSGLEVGFGGVWVGAAPYLLFIPDRDGNDVPDGEPQVLLDGWGYQDTHETLNAFIWGPDGWLYGCHGIFTHSRVGKPGTSDDDRVPLNAAIWRYHPTRHEFEVFAHGTSNPWGVDFNDHGQAFCTACVIPHLFHVIQGARYHRQAGQHFNRHTYGDITTIADHLHYLGETPHTGNDKSDAAGGGHAHSGAMIYLAGAWPAEYRNQIFMNNIHGQRLNVDVLQPSGSGYIGSHGSDFLLTGDRASQILNLRYGPDGQATMIDWYDMQACHLREPERHDRSNGRIYRIIYGEQQPVEVDLQQSTDLELAEMTLDNNDWYVRHARRVLQERAASRAVDAAARRRLQEIASADTDDTRRLRAMWALHVTGGISEELHGQLLADESPYVRGWTIQLALEDIKTPRMSSSFLTKMEEMARDDDSPVVRLYLASALQQLRLEDRWEILEAITTHAEDARDHNLPLMIWYAAEPLAELDPERALALALSASESIPLLGEFMLRRIGSADTKSSLNVLVRGLGNAEDAALRLTFLKAMRAALRGQRQVEAPDDWPAVFAALTHSPDDEVRLHAAALGATFGDVAATDHLRKLVTSTSADVDARRVGLEALLTTGDSQLAKLLTDLVKDPHLSELAIHGLAQYAQSDAAGILLETYNSFSSTQKRLALATLSSRAEWAMELLEAIESEKVASTDLTADLARQIQYLKNDEVQQRLARIWGRVRETDADKAALIAGYKQLVSDAQGHADLPLGRAIFAQTCQRCHTLYGAGGDVGPDLTGSNRADLDYLMSNIVDPSAVMAKEYQQSTVITTDGRVITGIVRAEDAKSLTIQTADATIIVPKGEVDERLESDKSMMPDDQLKQFNDDHVCALIAYLQSKKQVPVLATAENARELFNGQDLSGWTGNSQLWSVEEGEIVGRTAGLARNEFLVSDMTAGDFRLTLEVKLVDNAGNSGIQFRSQSHDAEVSGYQADIGAGWWGKLYEENGRALLWDKSGEEHARMGDWNSYEIHAVGSKIRTFINGKLCVDLDDPQGARRGVFALQLHAGPAMEVRFRNVSLHVPSDTVLLDAASR